MILRRYGINDYVDMPWKNGGGVTRELLKLPHPHDPTRFLARLSIAQVAESGPFSVFPGIDRTIMLLEGAGMALSVEGGLERVLDRPWRPYAFPGEARTECRLLGGPVRDFNLMLARDVVAGRLEVLELAADQEQEIAPAELVLLYGLAGLVRIAGETLEPGETLYLEAPERLFLSSAVGASLVLIRLHRR